MTTTKKTTRTRASKVARTPHKAPARKKKPKKPKKLKKDKKPPTLPAAQAPVPIGNGGPDVTVGPGNPNPKCHLLAMFHGQDLMAMKSAEHFWMVALVWNDSPTFNVGALTIRVTAAVPTGNATLTVRVPDTTDVLLDSAGAIADPSSTDVSMAAFYQVDVIPPDVNSHFDTDETDVMLVPLQNAVTGSIDLAARSIPLRVTGTLNAGVTAAVDGIITLRVHGANVANDRVSVLNVRINP